MTKPRPVAVDRFDHDRPRRRGAAPFAEVEHEGIRSAPIGREGVENVTWGASRLDIPSPMPYTRVSASREPNGPQRSRFSTMRAAREGPIQGRPSISARVALSRSMGARAESRFDCDGSCLVRDSLTPLPRFVERFARAPSFSAARAARTRAICASSAATSAVVGAGRAWRDLITRATTPKAATAATTARARRSAGVEGMRRKCRRVQELPNPGYADGAWERSDQRSATSNSSNSLVAGRLSLNELPRHITHCLQRPRRQLVDRVVHGVVVPVVEIDDVDDAEPLVEQRNMIVGDLEDG